MQVSGGGVSLWYGTQDAHAPSGTVPAGRDQIVIIGLQPPDPAASIMVLYRINHGPPLTVPSSETSCYGQAILPRPAHRLQGG
jgi:hypothetical protein